MKNKVKNFNIIIVGTGGQGQITLLRILAEAAFSEGYEVRTAELHGLSQRGGSVEVQLRFGPPPKFGGGLYSPLVLQAGADLILSLEMHEALRALYYSNKNTQFLIDKFSLPIPGQKEIPEKEILEEIKKFTLHLSQNRKGTNLAYQQQTFNSRKGAGFTQKIELVPASEICQKKLEKKVLAGIYLISYASFKKFLPLKPFSILKAIKKIIPEKYLELNLKAFELAKIS